MAANPLTVSRLEALSERELRALTQAAFWYANYHGHTIAEQADDLSAAAIAQREAYLDLHSALEKLGVPRVLPDALRRG